MATFILRHEIRWMNGRQYGANVFHWRGNGTITDGPTMSKGFLENFDTIRDLFLDCCSVDLFLTSQKAAVVTGVDKGGWQIGYEAAQMPGTIDEWPLYNSIAPYLQWVNTDHARRQGRTFMPAPPADALADNALQPAYKALLEAFGDAMLAGVSDGAAGITYDLVLFQPSTGDVDEIAGFQGGRIIGLLKRRGRSF